jgi:hypothetical protein
VNEYVTRFTQLSRYALNEVDTDEMKKKCFLNGLNDGLALTRIAIRVPPHIHSEGPWSGPL